MKKLLTTLCLLTTAIAFAERQTENLRNWKFILDNPSGAEKIGFNDSSWQNVRVPHDWAIDKPFDMNIDLQYVKVEADGETTAKLRTGRTGALPCFGKAWYRTQIQAPADTSKRLFLEFDGAMSQAKVYVNGKYVGERPYGYASFCFEITKFVKFNASNVIAVSLHNEILSSRWYTGAGLYRNVRLVIKDAQHIAYNGIFITTPIVSKESATVEVKTELDTTQPLNIKYEILKQGSVVAQKIVSTNNTTTKLDVKNPELWDLENPQLYTLRTSLLDNNGNLLDNVETNFGIRTIEFSVKDGFKLNGKRREIQGVCMHHDLGPIGSAVNVLALTRQLRILKEMGCNAIRTSHNPPTPELLDLCDKMGFLVQAEAFDEWRMGKNKNGYARFFDKWAEIDLRDFIKRDRNHPCIFMWSIGNEVREQRAPDGAKVARMLNNVVKQYDTTRPTTTGMNNATTVFLKNKGEFAKEVDIAGINYNVRNYDKISQMYPNMLIHGSETASTVSSRGVYHFPVIITKKPFHEDYQTSSYDTEAPSWAQIPDEEFEVLDRNRNYFGEFVWTGFDYLGEPTPYNPGTPARSSYFGIIDLAGLKKDRYYQYQSRWNKTKKVLHVFPHWNWQNTHEGKTLPVMCYTNYPEAELFVNGKSMGKRKFDKTSENVMKRYRLVWDNVPYQAGELKIVAFDKNGNVAEEKITKTSGKPAKIKLQLEDGQSNSANKDNLIFVELSITDKNDIFCPTANQFVMFKVEGEGKLKALCNGDATDQTSFASTYMKTFSGKLIAVIEPSGKSGNISITAGGMNLKPTTLKIKTK